MSKSALRLILKLSICLTSAAPAAESMFEDGAKRVAKVDGRVITDADLQLAEAEIGTEIGNVTSLQRKCYLVEHLIENEIFAGAAVRRISAKARNSNSV